MSQKFTDPLEDQYHILRIKRGHERLEKLGNPKTFPKDHLFDYRDRTPDGFFLVKEGRVLVYEDSYDGEHRVYNIMRSGSLFLEEYVLFPKPCPVLFKTLKESVLVEISRCDLIRAMKNDIDVVLDLLESISEKFVSAMETQRIGARQNAEWKICRMIVSDLDNYGIPVDGGISVSQKISHQMLADILGLNRVTVTRKLKKLTDLGLISRKNGLLFVPDIKALLRHMEKIDTE